MVIDDIQRKLICVQILVRDVAIEISRRAPYSPLLRDAQSLEDGALILSTLWGLERSSVSSSDSSARGGAPKAHPPKGSLQ